MSKYIIELEDDIKYLIINGRADNRCYTLVRPVAELEVLNSDYINEHFGELQDEAYQRGLEDGRQKARVGCTGCKYESQTGEYLPCDYCMNNFTNQWTAKPSDRIEVGDEVIDKDGDTTIVTNIHERLFDGLCSDGSTMSDLFLEDVRKTGRHYDHIGKLLEAIRA